jgi:archaemetzincin
MLMNKRTRGCGWFFTLLALLISIAFSQEGRKEKVTSENKNICVCFIGDKDSMVMKNLPHFLTTAFSLSASEIQIGEMETNLDFAYHPQRKQYNSSAILEKLNTIRGKKCEHLLAIVGVDLYVPGLNFVFGEADFQSKVALISTIRLREGFYGLPENKQSKMESEFEPLFLQRVAKEAVHELGHTYGLSHCPNRKCVMYFSNSLSDTDFKSYLFCEDCKKRIK